MVMQVTKFFPHISKDVILGSKVTFRGDIYVEENCEFGTNIIIDASYFRIIIGKNCKIDNNTKITSENAPIDIGENVRIGKNTIIKSSIPVDTIIEDNKQI